ncbi:MAG TPA: cytochrome c, partial [Sinomonas sp.]|nr:cytochrome c [Sinomonas sp.]
MKALSQKRRHPLAVVALLVMGLLMTGALYSVATATNQAKADTGFSASDVSQGQKLFVANCATCHGMNAQGSQAAPSLVGVGAAAVDFQVGTGRMPMQMNGPQAPAKPAQFDAEETRQLAAYVAS